MEVTVLLRVTRDFMHLICKKVHFLLSIKNGISITKVLFTCVLSCFPYRVIALI